MKTVDFLGDKAPGLWYVEDAKGLPHQVLCRTLLDIQSPSQRDLSLNHQQ